MAKSGNNSARRTLFSRDKKSQIDKYKKSYNQDNILALDSNGFAGHFSKQQNDKKGKELKLSPSLQTPFQQKSQQIKVGPERDYYFNANAENNSIIPAIDVLVQDPYCIKEFTKDGNVTIIPMATIHHLNELKGKIGLSEDAHKAGQVIEEILKKKDGSLVIFHEYDNDAFSQLGLSPSNPQHLAIAAASKIYKDHRTEYKQVKFVSLDSYNRIIAQELGYGKLKVEDYQREHISVLGKSRELPTINVDRRKLKVDGSSYYLDYNESDNGKILENDGVVCYDKVFDKNSIIPGNSRIGSKFCAIKKGNRLVVVCGEETLSGLTPLTINKKSVNYEQQIAIHKLLDLKYYSHFLEGTAGCGKTLFALGGALNWLYASTGNDLRHILFVSPMIQVGDDDKMGFLPGKIEDKLAPWVKPAIDNFDILERYNEHWYKGDQGNQPKKKVRKNSQVVNGKIIPKGWLYSQLKSKGKFSAEPFGYLRGRTLNNAYVIVDDAQNLTRHQIKTIATRAGNDTIIVFTGDLNQTDRVIHMYGITRVLNGFAYGIQKMCDKPLVSRIVFSTSVRSPLATLAEQYL